MLANHEYRKDKNKWVVAFETVDIAMGAFIDRTYSEKKSVS